MPRTKKLSPDQEEFVEFIIREFFPHLKHLTEEGPDEVYERNHTPGAKWRVRSHWFPANPDHPSETMRPPMLEVSVTVSSPERGKSKHYWFYRPGTGNDIHPEVNGWRVHAWVG